MGFIKDVQTCLTAEVAQCSFSTAAGEVYPHGQKSARISRNLDGWLTVILSIATHLDGEHAPGQPCANAKRHKPMQIC